MKTKTFTPVESMNPIYLGVAEDQLYQSIIEEHGGRTYAEIKEDGYRVQVHKKGDQVKAFTRSLKPVKLELFPELQDSLQHLPDCILDAELAGDGQIGHNGFLSVKKRFRSNISAERIAGYLESGIVSQMPLRLAVFDTLCWERKNLLERPLEERRKYTEKVDEQKISPSTLREIDNPRALQSWFERLVKDNYEGLVCKNPSSHYLPGKRTHDWVKLKRAETLDLAVLGVYLKEDQISQLLCGAFNPTTRKYETLAKVNAKREGLNVELDPLLRPHFQKSCPDAVVLHPQIAKKENQTPHQYVNPLESTLVEVAAMNFQYGKNWHSCGLEDDKSYSLRIAWLKGIREDKSVREATTTQQVKEFYHNERQAER